MNLSRRFLLPLAGLLSGLACGAGINSLTGDRTPAPRRKIRPVTTASGTPNQNPSQVFDRLLSTRETGAEKDIRMQQLILRMTPGEARERLLSTSTWTRSDFTKELLACQAAEGDPCGLFDCFCQSSPSHGAPAIRDPVALRGVLKAWVKTDPETALARASGAGRACRLMALKAWAEWDSAACAKALERQKEGGVSEVQTLVRCWIINAPMETTAWLSHLPETPWWREAAVGIPEKSDDPQAFTVAKYGGYLSVGQSVEERAAGYRDLILQEAFREGVKWNPVTAFQEASALSWGPLIPSALNRADDMIAVAFKGYADLDPEGAARAFAAFPPERQDFGYLPSFVGFLESNRPGAGLEFIQGMPEGWRRDYCIEHCIEQAPAFDAAREWMTLIQHDEVKGFAADRLIYDLASDDPYAARAWMEELETTLPPQAFERVQESFVRRIQECAPGLAAPWIKE